MDKVSGRIVLLTVLSLFLSSAIVNSQDTLFVGTGRAFPTLQDAYKAIPQPLTKNITVALCDDFAPNVTFDWIKSGTPAFTLKITAVNGAKVKGNKINGIPKDAMRSIRIYGSYVTIENMVFDDFKAENSTVMFQLADGGHNIVRNCLFSNFVNPHAEAALSIFSSSDNLVENCTFTNMNGGPQDQYLHCVYISKNSSNNRILHNTVNYCSGDPFVVKFGSNNNLFDGNKIIKCGGPGYFGTQPGDTTSRGNIVKNTTAQGPDPVNGYYGAYVKRFRGGRNGNGDLGKIFIDGGNNSFITHSTNVTIDYVIDESDAKIVFHDAPLAQAILSPPSTILGLIEKRTYGKPIYVNGVLADNTTSSITLSDTTSRPRKIAPFRILMAFDTSSAVCADPSVHNCEINLEKWVSGRGNGPAVFAVTGNGAQVKFQLTNLTGNYDMFLLWSSRVYTKAVIEKHFNDQDKGWRYFNDNSAYLNSVNPDIKARSTNPGTQDESFVRFLNNNDRFWVVVCPNKRASGTFKFTAKPANSNY